MAAPLTALPVRDDEKPPPSSIADSDSIPVSPSPFTTTSDVLRQLNAVLAQLDSADDATEGGRGHGVNDSGHNLSGASTGGAETSATPSGSAPPPPRFELQRRFEDGSTRKATEAELKSHDFEGKLKQVALHLSSLTTAEEREQFVQSQIEYGNQLFASKLYEDAMDVYLTCLAGVDMSRRSSEQEGTSTDDGVRGSSAVLLVRILHNLALSALKLGWNNKCLKFSSMGLQALGLGQVQSCVDDHGDGDEANSSSTAQLLGEVASAVDVSEARKLYAAKLYHVHAKASRLTGQYSDAQHSLAEALRWIHDVNNTDTSISGNDISRINKDEEGVGKTTTASTTAQRQQVVAIQKEQRLLRDAMQRGRDNRIRQRTAMQSILASATPESSDSSSTTGSEARRPSSSSIPRPLYDVDQRKDQSTDSRSATAQRPYSNLRSPSYYEARRRRPSRTGAGADAVKSDDEDNVDVDGRRRVNGTSTTNRKGDDGCCRRVWMMLRSWILDETHPTTAKHRAESK